MSSLKAAEALEEHEGRLTGTHLKCCAFRCSMTLSHTAGVCHDPGTRTKVGLADMVAGTISCGGVDLNERYESVSGVLLGSWKTPRLEGRRLKSYKTVLWSRWYAVFCQVRVT
jgi:hypothetical protein